MTGQWKPEHDALEAARKLDREDPLRGLREEFAFPSGAQVYLAGHSLGLMPKRARAYVAEELDAWGELAVEGHFHARHPWLPYHENVTSSFARLVGARESEVVAMNSLTTNLHLMMVSFYRPTAQRFRILIENNAFPSDRYAADSQARFHGFDPKEAVVELRPRAGEMAVRPEDVLEQIAGLGPSLALVLLGNCNYLSGQRFAFDAVAEAAHRAGALCGFNLAHGAGNLALQLHDWNVDFAVWCSYKYLNAGPGGIAGAFVHESHLGRPEIPRFEGWWGHDKETRFRMGPQFKPLRTAEAWQLSNPPIFQLAALRASMELFDQAGMPALRAKGDRLTSYAEWLLRKHLAGSVEVITPELPHRGSMLCLRFPGKPREFAQALAAHGVAVDFREPDIIRATPAPLYNSFEDVFRFVEVLKERRDEA
jgi:kynureninase